jgi:hypothetical protein
MLVSFVVTAPVKFGLKTKLPARPKWVNRVTLTLRQSHPVFLSKRTISEMADMSQRCQQRTLAPQRSQAPGLGIVAQF